VLPSMTLGEISRRTDGSSEISLWQQIALAAVVFLLVHHATFISDLLSFSSRDGLGGVTR